MKIFLLFAMAIIFISVFFILSISAKLIEEYKFCLEYQNIEHCDISGLGWEFVQGMFIIGCFILIDTGVITFLIKHYLMKNESVEWRA